MQLQYRNEFNELSAIVNTLVFLKCNPLHLLIFIFLKQKRAMHIESNVVLFTPMTFRDKFVKILKNFQSG